jgi:arginase family enzyme
LLRYGRVFDTGSRKPLGVPVFDAGDVCPASPEEFGEGPDAQVAALHETHRRATERARQLHARGLIVVGIGGGHDMTFPTVRALAEHSARPVAGINVDAHLDVRPEAGSGMPYRALIERHHLDPAHFVELGIGRFTCDPEHVAWLDERRSTIITIDTALANPSAAIDHAFAASLDRAGVGFVSIDLDAIDAGMAPGVSAINPMGMPVPFVAQLAERAGLHPAVQHFDLMELSPPHDVDDRTARLAVHLFLHFLAGLASRGGAR